eukprot:7288947-Prymnesium_polylepis.1
MLKLRAARDKAQGRSAAWYLARPAAQPYCGLHNEGATCYLNSLLQALFVLEPVRKAVYAFEYGGEAVHGPADACVPLQLAKLFARMQLSSCHAASTTDLTASFGWSRAESFRQHDVQELCRVLFTALGKYGVDLEARLLEGTLTSTLRCLTCGHRSTRDEAFCDVSLDVGASASLEHALGEFTKWEVLDDYRCDVCEAKVPALKGMRLSKLPPVVMLQLKRFTFDFETLRRRKLNHRVAFPFAEPLDMAPYVDEPPPPPDVAAAAAGSGGEGGNDAAPPPALYDCVGVMLHAGSAQGGHYT